MLTKKQYELLAFIDERLRGTGVSPSYDEMKDALGLRSKSGIHRLVTGLEERGFIRRLAHRARALEVLKLPENMNEAAENPEPKPSFTPCVIEGDFRLPAAPKPAANESMALPMLGRIAAGTPIEALREESAMIDVPSGLIGRGDHYALEVDGDSMVDAGIMDGDTVIIERCEKADNGTIVVALVDDFEVTLKRIRQKGGAIALEPANRDYETRIFGPDRVNIQGRLVGLMRKY